MPSAITDYCKNTFQAVPDSIGQIAQCAYQSLVLKYVLIIKQLEEIIGKRIELIHMVGGDSKNRLLCQWVSNALCIPLISGPSETTATGNILLQMIAVGDIRDIEESREVLLN